jgi:hypothetical protein
MNTQRDVRYEDVALASDECAFECTGLASFSAFLLPNFKRLGLIDHRYHSKVSVEK